MKSCLSLPAPCCRRFPATISHVVSLMSVSSTRALACSLPCPRLPCLPFRRTGHRPQASQGVRLPAQRPRPARALHPDQAPEAPDSPRDRRQGAGPTATAAPSFRLPPLHLPCRLLRPPPCRAPWRHPSQAGSESMYPVLAETLQKGDNGTTIGALSAPPPSPSVLPPRSPPRKAAPKPPRIAPRRAGHAIVYECVKTITQIAPNQQLIEVAADLVARFLRSKSHNLRVRAPAPHPHPHPPPSPTPFPPPEPAAECVQPPTPPPTAAAAAVRGYRRPRVRRPGAPEVRRRAPARRHRLPRGAPRRPPPLSPPRSPAVPPRHRTRRHRPRRRTRFSLRTRTSPSRRRPSTCCTR